MGEAFALAGIGDYFTTLYNYHFGVNQVPLHEKARAMAELMNKHEMSLCAYLLENLSDLPIRIFGRSTIEQREANIALSSPQISSKALADGLVNSDIAAKNGHFYAYRLLRAMGVEDMNDGVLRISLSHYNTLHEVERCVAGLRALLSS